MTESAAPDPRVPDLPVVKPGLRRLWRDDDELQLGVAPPHALVLRGLERALPALDRIDGRTPRERLERDDDVATLLHQLAVHDALDDAASSVALPRSATETGRSRVQPDVAAWALRGPAGHAVRLQHRRRSARVVVHGAGRVGALVAVLLAAGGVGRVDVVDPAALRAGDLPAPLPDLEPGDETEAPPTRADAARRWCDRLGTGSVVTPRLPHRASTGTADVVVLAPASSCGAVDPAVTDALVRDGVPHVPAHVRESSGVVGPFVLPGRGPCLRCVELARTDNDRAWPRLLAQLVAGPGPTATEPVDPCDGVLAALVAAHAALEVLSQVDGAVPSTWSVAHEVRADDPVVRLKRWAVHPACGCGWGQDDEPPPS